MRRYLSVLFCLLACFAHAQTQTTSASMFRGDLQHSGVYMATGAPTLHGVKWKYATKGKLFSSVTFADGVAYAGSTDHFMYALDADTGALKWKFETFSRITSTAAIADGLVLFP